MNEAVIDIEDLTRTFSVKRRGADGRRRRSTLAAVDAVTFRVLPGESVGYIGANGAGKSTTIKMLCGILVPTSGRVRTCGL
ncbi:MAG: viologen exporter family transport system ATP-binding protein, partial [Nocardioidaceae bacterium]|nr:viologen exporter family transport system ATP-binding protein [Nocardioidaceae bacterium]